MFESRKRTLFAMHFFVYLISSETLSQSSIISYIFVQSFLTSDIFINLDQAINFNNFSNRIKFWFTSGM